MVCYWWLGAQDQNNISSVCQWREETVAQGRNHIPPQFGDFQKLDKFSSFCFEIEQFEICSAGVRIILQQ